MDSTTDKIVTLIPVTLDNLRVLVRELNIIRHPSFSRPTITDFLGERVPSHYCSADCKGRLFFPMPLCEIRRKRVNGEWCNPIEMHSMFFQQYSGENVVVGWCDGDGDESTYEIRGSILEIVSGRVLNEDLDPIQILKEGGQLHIRHDLYFQNLYGYSECRIRMINRRSIMRGPKEIKEALEEYLKGLEFNHPHRKTYENAVEALLEDSI